MSTKPLNVFLDSILFLCVAAAACQASSPINVGTQLQPFVDDFLIDKMQNATLTLHQPVRREVAIVHDAVWEGNCSGYHTVFRDGDRYRMYYRGSQIGSKSKGIPAHPPLVCYAESEDGVHWTKPDLELFEYQGSKKNNIIRLEPTPEGFSVFKDANPKCAAKQRYKAVTLGKGGLIALQSPDGIHWSALQEKPIITKGVFDSMNLAFWDSERKCYVDFHRAWRGGRRDVMTCTSPDFIHWTSPVWVDCVGAAKEELYTNGVLRYDRAPQILLGFPVRYMASRQSTIKPNYGPVMNGITDALFMTSRDGLHFRRWAEAFIRPGLNEDCWTTRNNYPAWGLVYTMSDKTPEISLYASEGFYSQGETRCRLRRFSLRVDGFASVQANSQGGEMVTQPLVFAGKTLSLNLSTSAAGSVRVEIQDIGGKPIPGFALDDCPDVYGDKLSQTVAWKQSGNVSRLAGRTIRLRFVLKDADIYAFQFK